MMKITDLQEARYHGSSYPLFYVIYDPNWEAKEVKPGLRTLGPFLYFDGGIHHSSGPDIGVRKTGTFKTPESAEMTLAKWQKYYNKRTASRFRTGHSPPTRADHKRWDGEEQIVSRARVGAVELKF